MKRQTSWILNTKKDFVNFCVAFGYKRKDINGILKLLPLFISDSIMNKWKFVLNWVWTFYKKETTSTLRPWEIFYKVKCNLSNNLTYLLSKNDKH